MTSVAYRWETADFLRAHDAGVFQTRVELVDGEVWPVVLGDWHGEVTARVVGALTGHGRVSQATLATGGSLPDPDVWLRTTDAQPVATVSARLSRWRAADVLLVVEVSDETVGADLTVKARLYGSAGYPCYWVVTREGIHRHTEPTTEGYAAVRMVAGTDEIGLPDGSSLPVRALLPT